MHQAILKSTHGRSVYNPPLLWASAPHLNFTLEATTCKKYIWHISRTVFSYLQILLRGVICIFKHHLCLQVWSGNDDCKEVTWQECSLKEIEVPFITTDIVCTNTTKIPWMDCEETVKEQMTMNMTCVPKAAVKCVPITETLCTTGQLFSYFFNKGNEKGVGRGQ